MVVHAKVILTSDVEDLDKADDWFAEVHEALEGQTTCRMKGLSSNAEEPIEITKEE